MTHDHREPRPLRLGLLQTAPVFGRVERNLAQIAQLRGTLGSVDLALTPELSVNGYGFGTPGKADLLSRDDPRLASLAARGVALGFAERSASGPPWNAYLLPDPVAGSGAGAGVEAGAGAGHLQRKLHLVSYAPWNEHLSFQPGARLRTADFQGTRIATVICNDMWHPVIPWLAVHSGAEILVVPTASMEGPDPARIRRAWEVIVEHAAVLLQCYVAFVNRCGDDGGARFWGGSRVVGPDGDVLTCLGDEPGAVAVELDMTALRRLRAAVPLLAEARPELVAGALRSGPAGEREPTSV